MQLAHFEYKLLQVAVSDSVGLFLFSLTFLNIFIYSVAIYLHGTDTTFAYTSLLKRRNYWKILFHFTSTTRVVFARCLHVVCMSLICLFMRIACKFMILIANFISCDGKKNEIKDEVKKIFPFSKFVLIKRKLWKNLF